MPKMIREHLRHVPADHERAPKKETKRKRTSRGRSTAALAPQGTENAEA